MTRRRTDRITAAAYQRRVTEAEMETGIREVVDLKGGRLFHVRDARQSPELEDMPDLLIVIPGLLAVLELKSQARELTSGQRDVAQLMDSTEQFVAGVVRPSPRRSEYGYDEVLEILRRTR